LSTIGNPSFTDFITDSPRVVSDFAGDRAIATAEIAVLVGLALTFVDLPVFIGDTS
jgi:hypothetical protein